MEKLSYHPKNFIKMKSFGKKKNFCTSITERIASKMHQNTLLRKLDFSITIFFSPEKKMLKALQILCSAAASRIIEMWRQTRAIIDYEENWL